MQYLAYSTLNQDEQLGMGAHEVVHAHRFVMVVHRRFADGFFHSVVLPRSLLDELIGGLRDEELNIFQATHYATFRVKGQKVCPESRIFTD